jgi:hypothetical protein
MSDDKRDKIIFGPQFDSLAVERIREAIGIMQKHSIQVTDEGFRRPDGSCSPTLPAQEFVVVPLFVDESRILDLVREMAGALRPDPEVNLRSAIRSTLGAFWHLGCDADEIVRLVEQGLRDGRGKYGALNLSTDKRDLPLEGLQELRDALVYLPAALLRTEKD